MDMGKSWQGKAVSIQCHHSLGIFQGTIKEADAQKITIVRTFRNGLPFRSLETEVTIMASDIADLSFIEFPSMPEATKVQNGNGPLNAVMNNGLPHTNGESPVSSKTKDSRNYKINKSPLTTQRPIQQKQPQHSAAPSSPFSLKSFGNMIPAKVEVRLGTSAPSTSSGFANSKPHELSGSFGKQHYNNTPNTTPYKGGDKKQQLKTQNRKTAAYTRNQAFGTSADDPIMDEDFDFEKNLALFDKQAIWNEIDAIQKPDLLRQTSMVKPKKNYRHDENILESKPTESRQITSNQKSANGNVEFATDDGLVIPTVPLQQRQLVQTYAESSGLTWTRQCDMLARGTAEMALTVLGGARRLTPNNQHQWPTIVVICDAPWNEPSSEVGLATGRHLASHGLQVCVYLGGGTGNQEKQSVELALFVASGASTNHTSLIEDLPACDLVILAVQKGLKPPISKWINDNRAQTLAIDPPVAGLGTPNTSGVSIKYSILPVLPVNGISAACGKLYLCNLGIPERFYIDAGIKYRSPFGHKFVIPIHLMA